MTVPAATASQEAPMARAREVLGRVFGHPGFRGLQAAVVERLLGGGDCLVLMPTGAGKSLCYQVPALVRPGLGLVVSPLIALMQDQVEALRELGVRAAYLNSTQQAGEASAIERAARRGELDLLYVAPERLLTERCLALLDECPLALIAIDEAHCVSQWGHDFRPEYLQLAPLGRRFPGVPRIALTATADPRTREEIVTGLDLTDVQRFVASFDRPNIRYRIVGKDNPQRQLLQFIDAEMAGQAGIVYCATRNRVEETAAALNRSGIDALAYHAGLDAGTRASNQQRFLQEDGRVMVATIAFGMGIDKPDVRFVAHLDMPRSIEGYYQETGRAGRDGEPAQAWMTYGLADVVQQRRLIDQSSGGETFRRVAAARLDAMLALAETTDCRRVRLLEYFGEAATPCGNCDNCLAPPERWDGTDAARKLLSCVYRARQASGIGFGALHVIAILRGQDNERTRRWGHEKLSTFGIGAELGEHTWRSVLRQLVAQGLLAVDHENHQTLELTAASREFLRGDQRLWLRGESAEPVRARSRSKAGRAAARPGAEGLSDPPVVLERFERLRRWRLERSRERGVPPYVIFHDAVLREIARRQPTTSGELAGISGIGTAKLESYGDELLRLMNEDEPSPPQ